MSPFPDACADEMVIATSSDLNSSSPLETLATNPAKDDHTKASGELYTDPAQGDTENKDPPSLEPTMDTVLSEESDHLDAGARPPTEEELERDVNNVANYIDIKKVVGKNESNYYYTPKNKATRKTVEKIKKSKGRAKEVDMLDTSQHTRRSLLTGCRRKSSYFGPETRRKDGSEVKGILKDHAYHIRKSSLLSGLSTDDSEPAPPLKRGISWSSVDIREHTRIAGDNPCVSSGVPLSIGWESIQHDPIPLDDYEKAKGPSRDKIEMMVPASVRRSMLRDEFKVSVDDLNASMKSVAISKRQRTQTVATEHLEGWHELAQSAKRKFKRFMNKSSTKQEQAALWEEAHNSATKAFLEGFSVDAVATKSQHLKSSGGLLDGVEPAVMPTEISIKPDE
ncbi:hypothetical protein ACHAWC_009574 [Mediolabrus comicus]